MSFVHFKLADHVDDEDEDLVDDDNEEWGQVLTKESTCRVILQPVEI